MNFKSKIEDIICDALHEKLGTTSIICTMICPDKIEIGINEKKFEIEIREPDEKKEHSTDTQNSQ